MVSKFWAEDSMLKQPYTTISNESPTMPSRFLGVQVLGEDEGRWILKSDEGGLEDDIGMNHQASHLGLLGDSLNDSLV